MSNPNTRGRGRRRGLVIAGIVLLVLAGVALTMYAVGGKGVFSRVFAGGEEKKAADEHQGKVAVLVSPTVLQPFTMMDPNGLIDPKTGDYYVAWVSEKIATEDKMVRDPNVLRGRVLCREKQPWRAFSEADFYAPGSQASPTSGIKPGNRGVTLSPEKIEGLAPLKYGDRFDLVAVKSKVDLGSSNSGTTYVDPSLTAKAEADKGWAADRKIIAEDASVLIALPTTGGTQARTLFASMRDAEAMELALAIEKGAHITVMASTGRAGGDPSSLPVPVDAPKTNTIQVTNGGTSSTAIVPPTPTPAEPPVAPQPDGAKPVTPKPDHE